MHISITIVPRSSFFPEFISFTFPVPVPLQNAPLQDFHPLPQLLHGGMLPTFFCLTRITVRFNPEQETEAIFEESPISNN